jgi:hypothetical protein
MRNLTVRLTSDNQIEVQVGTESRTGECYYLDLRSEIDQSQIGSAELAEGVRSLLRGWLNVLTKMSDGDQVFLPFDFSDEYTRWLTVHRSDREAAVVFGWADVEGWAISPTNPDEYSAALPGFQPDDPLYVQTFYLPRLIGDLRCSLLNIS